MGQTEQCALTPADGRAHPMEMRKKTKKKAKTPAEALCSTSFCLSFDLLAARRSLDCLQPLLLDTYIKMASCPVQPSASPSCFVSHCRPSPFHHRSFSIAPIWVKTFVYCTHILSKGRGRWQAPACHPPRFPPSPLIPPCAQPKPSHNPKPVPPAPQTPSVGWIYHHSGRRPRVLLVLYIQRRRVRMRLPRRGGTSTRTRTRVGRHRRWWLAFGLGARGGAAVHHGGGGRQRLSDHAQAPAQRGPGAAVAARGRPLRRAGPWGAGRRGERRGHRRLRGAGGERGQGRGGGTLGVLLDLHLCVARGYDGEDGWRGRSVNQSINQPPRAGEAQAATSSSSSPPSSLP